MQCGQTGGECRHITCIDGNYAGWVNFGEGYRCVGAIDANRESNRKTGVFQ